MRRVQRVAWQHLHLLHVGLTTYYLLLTTYSLRTMAAPSGRRGHYLLLTTHYVLLTTHDGGTFWTSGSPWCCLNEVSIACAHKLGLGVGLGLG